MSGVESDDCESERSCGLGDGVVAHGLAAAPVTLAILSAGPAPGASIAMQFDT
jgi:hypothetical protein